MVFSKTVPSCQYLPVTIYCNLYKYGLSVTMISVSLDLFYVASCRQLKLIWVNFEMANIQNTHLNQHPDPATDYP